MTQNTPNQQKGDEVLTTSSLTAAIRIGQLEVVNQAIKLSKEGKFDLNSPWGNLVSEAINNNQKEIAITLIDAGAELSGSAAKDALKKGWKEVVDQAIKLSKEGKFDLNPMFRQNFLEVAIQAGSNDLVTDLINGGAKVEFKHLARSIKEGNVEVYRSLSK